MTYPKSFSRSTLLLFMQMPARIIDAANDQDLFQQDLDNLLEEERSKLPEFSCKKMQNYGIN